MKVLVLDTVHGGKIIAESYLKKKNEVAVVDVYKTSPKELMNSLRHRGAVVADSAPAEHFDIVTMPCHCPDEFLGQCTYDRRLTFSDSVKELIEDRYFRIEVTGVKGKTSTCYVLAHLLEASGRKVFLHTSKGLGPYIKGKHIVTDFQSIAPPTLLILPKGDYDVQVCEVSLGGSGRADIAGITNLCDDYGIARNTRRAESGKKDILTDKVNVVPEGEMGIWSKYGKPLRPYRNRIEIAGKPEIGKPLKVIVDYRGRHDVELPGEYMAVQYIEDISMALEICDAMDVPAEAIVRGLASFKGVPGRGEITVKDGVTYITEHNPGISAESVGYTLSSLERMGALGNAVLILDPVRRKVCEHLDLDALKKTVSGYGVDFVLAEIGKEPEIPSGKTTVVKVIKEGFQ